MFVDIRNCSLDVAEPKEIQKLCINTLLCKKSLYRISYIRNNKSRKSQSK